MTNYGQTTLRQGSLNRLKQDLTAWCGGCQRTTMRTDSFPLDQKGWEMCLRLNMGMPSPIAMRMPRVVYPT
jgi:hypothetical protein